MATDNQEHEREVKDAVARALAVGAGSFGDILRAANGADPRLVHRKYSEIKGTDAPVAVSATSASRARRLSANLPSLLPAPDPMWSQWWFTLDTTAILAQAAWTLCGGGATAFLGCPTVGYHFRNCYNLPTSILDVDPDVVASLQQNTDANLFRYDVVAPLPQPLIGKHSAVLLDPPWYPDITWQFICRARELLSPDGFIMCVVPSRLTRPGLIAERSSLLRQLLQCGIEIVALESERVNYRVPHFEARAYADLEDFDARQWRCGDLLILRVRPDSNPKPLGTVGHEERLVFSQNPNLLRVFLSKPRTMPALSSWFELIDEFESEVSSRHIPLEQIALWTTAKTGARVKDADVAQVLLSGWANKQPQSSVTELLLAQGINSHEVGKIVVQFREILGEDTAPGRHSRRTPVNLTDLRLASLSPFAAQPTRRKHDYSDDGFRLSFQRDRDRVLWSPALRRLANKTQVFAAQTDHALRGRLGHSIEVMALASTIASSFGLDRDLTEAGALAHDIGHCPFGHAGEHALDKTLNEIDPRLGGFNHYEHGLDVVRWLEDIYRSPGAGAIPGLNLTDETVECIIKHTYFRDKHPLSQASLLSRSKHQDLDKRMCHLEGQAVRIADKISYLISDLEDGIRMGAFKSEDLHRCRLFDRPPIDLAPERDESLYERFISQRRAILKVLMEDVLTASDGQLRTVNSVEDVRNGDDYVIAFSPAMRAEVTEVWHWLQAGILHKNERVVAANMRAARVISDLLVLFAVAPELIDSTFSKSHNGLRTTEYMSWYTRKLGPTVGVSGSLFSRYFYDHVIGRELRRQGDNYLIDTPNLVLAKDYVASLTNSLADEEHRRHFGGAPS